MGSLLVRGIDDLIIRALKQRAGENGQSAEAEHRAILVQALARPQRRTLAEVLTSMPNVGIDADFERVNPANEAPRVFD